MTGSNFLWAGLGCLVGAILVVLWIMWYLRNRWR